MARVPQYSPGGNVSSRGIDFRRAQPESTGMNEVGQALQETGQRVFKDAIKQQEEVALDQAEEARLELERAWMEGLHGEKGYLTTSGKDAFDGKEAFLETMNERQRQILENLSPEAQAKFGNTAERISISNTRAVMTHAEQGRKAWSMGIQQASAENAVEKGALNYRNDQEILTQRAVLRESTRTLGKMEGIDPKQMQERLETADSKYFKAVIGRAIEQEPERGAQLIEKYGKYMEVADRDQVEADLKGYKRDKEVMETVDTWMTAGLNLTDAREQAQGIDDPETRKQAMSDFKIRYKEREYETQQNQIDTFNKYSSAIDNGEIKYSQISRKERDFMTHGQRQSLKALERQKYAKEEIKEMPFKLRAKLDNLIGDNKLADAEKLLSESYHLMTKQDRKEYSKAVNKGTDDPEVFRLYNYKEMVKSFGKELSDNDKQTFSASAEKWRQNYIRTHDKEPTPEEEREAIVWLLANEDGWDYGERYDEPELFNERVLNEQVQRLNAERAKRDLPPANRKQIETLDKRLREQGWYLGN